MSWMCAVTTPRRKGKRSRLDAVGNHDLALCARPCDLDWGLPRSHIDMKVTHDQALCARQNQDRIDNQDREAFRTPSLKKGALPARELNHDRQTSQTEDCGSKRVDRRKTKECLPRALCAAAAPCGTKRKADALEKASLATHRQQEGLTHDLGEKEGSSFPW